MKKKESGAIVIPDGVRSEGRVLLHACCAPCSSAIVEWLLAHGVRPTIYYFNPNIFPREEYETRKCESQRHAAALGLDWIDDDWSHAQWLCGVRGLEGEAERGGRCLRCFELRLTATARKARELGFGWFATTLASSRWKRLDQIEAAGRAAEAAVAGDDGTADCSLATAADASDSVTAGVAIDSMGLVRGPRFWAQNWRKGGLQERRNELLRQYDFYNQQYCGCEFSQRP